MLVVLQLPLYMFLQPQIEAAVQRFPLEYLLGDKAYVSEYAPQWLAERGIKAVIPVKKKWFADERKSYNVPLMHLLEWLERNCLLIFARHFHF